MGLSSSQARLLTLTSRQHTVEGEAQRIQANKLRLANDSDQAYMKYINALDDTALQTKQISKETGAYSWIGGSLNNLLRYQTSDDYTGSVFYVQDLATGQLYMPQAICDNYAAATPSGDDTIIMDFVKRCDSSLTYEKVDKNEDIKQEYETVMALGYNTAASDAILNGYNAALEADNAVIEPATALLGAIPGYDSKGLITLVYDSSTAASSFKTSLNELINSSGYSTTYSENERIFIQSALAVMEGFSELLPHDTTTTYDTGTVAQRTIQTIANPDKMKSTKNDKKYLEFYDYSDYQKFITMLNGGTVKWEGTVTTKVFWQNEGFVSSDDIPEEAYPYGQLYGLGLFKKENKTSNAHVEKDIDLYNDMSVTTITGATKTCNEIIALNSTYGSTYGEIFTNMLKNKISSVNNAKNYLASVGKSETDISKYKQYLAIKSQYEMYCVGGVYQPDYEFVPSDKVKAAYFEQIYNAIKAAGGCKPVTEERGKNENWVQNMIKSNQVMLTGWDEEHEMLSKTLPSLNINIQEVSDQNYIEQVAQEYEATLDVINAKDSRFDQRLHVLESERQALSTEIDSLKQVMKANIEANFKVFS